MDYLSKYNKYKYKNNVLSTKLIVGGNIDLERKPNLMDFLKSFRDKVSKNKEYGGIIRMTGNDEFTLIKNQ